MGRVVPGCFPDERNSTTPPRRGASGNRACAAERVRAAFGLQNAHRWKRSPCFASNRSAGWIGRRNGFLSMVGLVVGWGRVVAQREKHRVCQRRADGTARAGLAGAAGWAYGSARARLAGAAGWAHGSARARLVGGAGLAPDRPRRKRESESVARGGTIRPDLDGCKK